MTTRSMLIEFEDVPTGGTSVSLSVSGYHTHIEGGSGHDDLAAALAYIAMQSNPNNPEATLTSLYAAAFNYLQPNNHRKVTP